MDDKELNDLVDREMARRGKTVSGLSDNEKSENADMLHKLWTAALASPDYDKSAWLDVERQLVSADLI